MDRDSSGLYQPPYSLHVQEMRVCGQHSWGGGGGGGERAAHKALTRNAPTDAW